MKSTRVRKVRSNKTTSNVVKQLARVGRNMQTLNSRFTKLAGSRRPVRRRRNVNRGFGITATSIPMEYAYSVRQPTTTRVHTETACEYIGDFVIPIRTTVGEGVRFMMNPLTMFRTRLYNLARNYQKFRFTKLALKIQSSSTTSTNGLYVAGYCSNPDFEYSKENAVPAIFSLPGAQSTNVWRTIVVQANLQDKNKWYNLDEDSSEIMQTTQGYFAIAIQSPANSTANIVMPVLLDYTVQFSGNAFQSLNASNNIEIMPSGSFNLTSGNFVFTADSGEPPVPTITQGRGYIINPTYPVQANLVDTNIGVIFKTPSSFSFYQTVDEFITGRSLDIRESFTVERSTWSILN